MLPTKTMPVHRQIAGTQDMTVRNTVRSALPHACNLQPDQPIHHVRVSQKTLKERSRNHCTPVPCNCDELHTAHPLLFEEAQRHVILRTAAHWQLLFNPQEVHCATQNARNASLPDIEFIEQGIQRTHAACAAFMQGDTDFVLPTETIRHTLHAHKAQHVLQYPFMNPSVFESINDTLTSQHLQAAVWDKQPCKL